MSEGPEPPQNPGNLFPNPSHPNPLDGIKAPLPVIEEFQNEMLAGENLPPKADSPNFEQDSDDKIDEIDHVQKKSQFK